MKFKPTDLIYYFLVIGILVGVSFLGHKTKIAKGIDKAVKSGAMFQDYMELEILEEFLTHSDDIALEEIRNFIKENE